MGGLTHFAAEIMRARNQMPLTAVPYRGGALATTAIMSGEVPFGFASMSDAVAQVSAGTVRPLAISSGKRSPQMPHVPTLIEQGLVDFAIDSWNGLFAPAGTPKPIVNRLAAVMEDMAKDATHQMRLKDIGSIAIVNTPAEFTAIIRDDSAHWAIALSAIGISSK